MNTAARDSVSLHARWQRLPREARDTLFQLIVIGWTILPHVSHLAFWCSALAGVVLLWRASITLANGPLPRRTAVLVVMIIALGLTAWTERTLLGKEAGVSMLVVLLSLKTLEMRGRRDVLVLFFLGFFLVLTQCLYSQSVLVAASMALSTWGLLTAQVLSSMPVGKPTLARAAMIAARSVLLGLPLMLALFMLFPRIGPLWGLPQDAIARTGLSGSLRMGSVAEVANDDSIALRVRFDGAGLADSALYFRGPVLSRFDGTEWRSTPQDPLGLWPATPISPLRGPPPEVRLIGSGRSYEMILEPMRLALLPMLELTPMRADSAPHMEGWNLYQDAELRWQTDRAVLERLHLTGRAWARFEYGGRTLGPSLHELVHLPRGYNPRSIEWAQQLRARPDLVGADASRLAGELMRHITKESFSYTLLPGTYGTHSVDEFWFDRRQGFCEHFAVSFVVMMRAMGVPSRLVTGYQGAELPDADGWRVVRQSHAHAWAEYWQAGKGWQRADPTAAVAPDRVSASRPLTSAPGLVGNALNNMNPELAIQLRRAWELIDNRWNQWVMSYSRSTQFNLLKTLGFEAPTWSDLLLLLSLALSLGAFGGALWAWLDKRRIDPWVRLHGRIRQGLTQVGVASQAHEPPRLLAARLRQERGERGKDLALVNEYTAPGSCLWGTRGLVVALYLDPTMKLFDVKRDKLPVEIADYVVTEKSLKWSVQGFKDRGEVVLTLEKNADGADQPVFQPYGFKHQLREWVQHRPIRPNNHPAMYDRRQYSTTQSMTACERVNP